MGIMEPAFFVVLSFGKVNYGAATVSDDRGGFSCFLPRNTTQNHKNISFLIFFCLKIW
jgi:hypothetical protein